MNGDIDLDNFTAWRAAVTLSGLLVLVGCLSFLYHPDSLGVPVRLARVLLIPAGLLPLALLLRERRQPSLRHSLVLYAFLVVPALVWIWVLGSALGRAGWGWEPLFWQKVVLFTFALLYPGRFYITAGIMAVVVAEAFLEYWVGGLRLSHHVLRGEPWVTLLWGANLALIGFYRARLFAQVHAMQKMQREAMAAVRLARVALAIRDLMNSPFQTIRIGVDLLQSGPVPPEVQQRMERAFARITELSRILATYHADRPWRPEDEAFDPMAVLKSQVTCRRSGP